MCRSDDLISRQAAIQSLGESPLVWTDDEYELGQKNQWEYDIDAIKSVPSAQLEWKDLIQHFHDYQIEWLKSHYDIELEPQLEEMIIRFLHDTANSYMMEMDREKDE